MNTSSYPKAGVGIIVIKKENGKEYVMMHQRLEEYGNGYWGSGGGHLELGESLKAGALRELREEAGEALTVENIRFLGVMNLTAFKPKHYVDVSFVVDWVSGEPTNSAPEETSEWQWFALDELPSPLFPPVATYLEAIKSGENFFDSSFDD